MVAYNPYIGHISQVCGIEEHRLVGGKGDGMRLFQVRNGRGIEFTVSADRCGDISRMTYKGVNIGFFAPCGYVAPAYYDKQGDGFLKSFTAGFLTTCGLTAVGSPCEDCGEVLPLHGTIANTPAETVMVDSDMIYDQLMDGVLQRLFEHPHLETSHSEDHYECWRFSCYAEEHYLFCIEKQNIKIPAILASYFGVKDQ